MVLFCDNCGASVQEGKSFCQNCGNPIKAATVAASTDSGEQEERKKGTGGFFTSPAGIALVVILAVAVIAGITLGIIFLVRGNPNNTVDAETVKVWDEYERILEDSSTDVAQINMDPNALTKMQEDLKKSQERVAALEKVLKETAGTNARRRGVARRADNTRDLKADQMAAALAAYNLYIQKMDQFFGALIGAIVGNQLINPDVVNNLNAILAELQKLAADVKTLAGKFLDDNEKVIVDNFDPPVLLFAKSMTPLVEKSVADAQAAEAARLAAEQAAAEKAAAEAAAERQRQQEAAQPATLDASRCPNGDPYCPI